MVNLVFEVVELCLTELLVTLVLVVSWEIVTDLVVTTVFPVDKRVLAFVEVAL